METIKKSIYNEFKSLTCRNPTLAGFLFIN